MPRQARRLDRPPRRQPLPPPPAAGDAPLHVGERQRAAAAQLLGERRRQPALQPVLGRRALGGHGLELAQQRQALGAQPRVARLASGQARLGGREALGVELQQLGLGQVLEPLPLGPVLQRRLRCRRFLQLADLDAQQPPARIAPAAGDGRDPVDHRTVLGPHLRRPVDRQVAARGLDDGDALGHRAQVGDVVEPEAQHRRLDAELPKSLAGHGLKVAGSWRVRFCLQNSPTD